jgi:hypothetical protein
VDGGLVDRATVAMLGYNNKRPNAMADIIVGLKAMQEIILSAEQTSVLNHTLEKVTVLDANGFVVGIVARGCFTKEDIEEAKQALKSDGPWHTTSEVLAHLKSLAKP